MKKTFFLFLALFAFSFYYCGDKIEVYKSELKEVKVNTKIIKKIFDNKEYDVKISIGESFLGKVTSVSIEVLNDNASEYQKRLHINSEKINAKIKNFISSTNSIGISDSIGPTNCVSTCTKK